LGLGKVIEGNFDGGQVSSDGGLLLLRKADLKLGLTEMVAPCFGDTRRPDLVKHSIAQLFRQRVYAIAAGYEDCNDVERIGNDVMHRLAGGIRPNDSKNLASQPTLSRWENSVDETTLELLQKSLVLTYIRQQKRRPKVVKLAIDTTRDEVYGYQQMSFYSGFYKGYCFTPLFIFTHDGFPLAALLRPGNAGKYEGTLRMLRPIVQELRRAWPGVKIEFTADSAFAAPGIYDYCEENHVTYFIAIAGNSALQCESQHFVLKTKALYDELAEPTPPLKKYAQMDPKKRKKAWRQNEERIRFSSKTEGRMQETFEEEQVYIRKVTEFQYKAKSWKHSRRIVCKVEYTSEGPDVRYVVTNAKRGRPCALYAKYCQRAQCENWIKDMKTYLKCDRTSCQEFTANQFRLLLHTFGYILLWVLRRGAKLKNATVATVQIHLLKIGVLVKESVRRIRLQFASEHPWQDEFSRVWQSL
jgi:hypothetical protein